MRWIAECGWHFPTKRHAVAAWPISHPRCTEHPARRPFVRRVVHRPIRLIVGFALLSGTGHHRRRFVIFSRPMTLDRPRDDKKGRVVLKFFARFAARSIGGIRVAGAVAGLATLVSVWGSAAVADPAEDALAELNELSQQAEHLAETIHTAQVDLDKKLQVLREADEAYAVNVAALNSARTKLVNYQGAVDALAAAAYVGGQRDGLDAVLTAASPKSLIDKLAVQRVMATEMSSRTLGLRQAELEARSLEAASARSAVDAKAAVEAAVEMRADLQNRQSELQTQIVAVNARSSVLLPGDRGARAAALPASVVAASDLAAPVPTIGMNGLVPNARSLAAYIMSTYPRVQSIGGVRADLLPDHPSGRALDIMTGSNMDLGDTISADLQGQAGRFGVVYVMWRVPDHFNHVHVTVS